MRNYDFSEAALGRELEEEDMRAILESPKSFTRDSEKVIHFVKRALFTVSILRRRMEGLRSEVERLQVQKFEASEPLTRALEALRALSEEEKSKVLGAYNQERIALAEKSIKDAQRAQAGAMSESNRVRFMLAKLAKDPRLDRSAQEIIEDVVKQLPSASVTKAHNLPKDPDARLSEQLSTWPGGFAPKPRGAESDELGDLFSS